MTLEEMEHLCEGKPAPYKLPKRLTFPESIPRTLTGKIMKMELRKCMRKIMVGVDADGDSRIRERLNPREIPDGLIGA